MKKNEKTSNNNTFEKKKIEQTENNQNNQNQFNNSKASNISK